MAPDSISAIAPGLRETVPAFGGIDTLSLLVDWMETSTSRAYLKFHWWGEEEWRGGGWEGGERSSAGLETWTQSEVGDQSWRASLSPSPSFLLSPIRHYRLVENSKRL